MSEYSKPLPQPTPETQPYWDGCRQHKLLLQRCKACGTYRFYPRMFCVNPECHSDEADWVEGSGKGRLHTYTVSHIPGAPGFEDDLPYVVAIIELEEGVHMMSTVIECEPEDLGCDLPVQVVFDDVTEEISLPKFRPLS